MLLWLVLLGLGASGVALQNGVQNEMRIGALQVLGAINFSFHLFVLLVSNPFVQLGQTPRQGMGLNPLLEDPALAIHPPILYAGLALLSVLFAFSSIGFKLNQLDRAWSFMLRPWALLCWTFLTTGIALGSWWAYYELGWGGWWFWDPVENLSLLPWLIVTALIHALHLSSKESPNYFTAGWLGLLAFLTALISMFLVRSGALTSVHAFAIDPYRGGFLGAIFLAFASFALFRVIRYHRQRTEAPALLSRKSFLYLNILLLVAIMVIIFFGTTYPLILNQLTGRMISVGAPYFNITVMPFVFILVLLMTVLPFLPHRADTNRRLSYVLTLSLAIFLGLAYGKSHYPIYISAFLAAAAIMLLVTLYDVVGRRHNLSLKYAGMSLAHGTVALLVIAGCIDTFDKVETIQALKEKDVMRFQGYELSLAAVEHVRAPYFERQVIKLNFHKGTESFTLSPEKRYYPLHEMITTETAIHPLGLGDIYAVLGSADKDNLWVVKLFWHPTINLLWIGAALMILAGLLSAYASFKRVRKVLLIPFILMATDCRADDYKELISSMYCPSCQGQVLEESNSSLANHIKNDIQKMLDKGISPEQIKQHYVQLYGEQVLLKPELDAHNYILWALPILIFLFMIFIFLKRSDLNSI